MTDAPDRIYAMPSDDGWMAPYCGRAPYESATEYRRADLPPTVKPLVWDVHPVGLVAGSSYGSSYLIDTRRKRANIIKGLTLSQEFETVEQAIAAAQADFEARILSALDWPLTASDKTRTS